MWVIATIGLTAFINILFPLPNQWVLLPLFALVSISSDRFATQAVQVAKYLKRDFNRAVLGGLILTGTLTWVTALAVPSTAALLIAYTSLFWAMSGSLRTTFEATSFLFREDVRSGLDLFRAFAVTRLTYFAVTPLMALASVDVASPEAISLVALWIVLMLPQFVTLPFAIPLSTNRPIVYYLMRDRRVEAEIQVMKKLETGPLSERQLAFRMQMPVEELRPVLQDLQSRYILVHDRRRWDLARGYKGVLLLLKRKQRWKRTRSRSGKA